MHSYNLVYFFMRLHPYGLIKKAAYHSDAAAFINNQVFYLSICYIVIIIYIVHIIKYGST